MLGGNMYEYIQDKKLRSKLRECFESNVSKVQKFVKDYFTFSYKLIGSGDNRLMMVNGKNKTIDLDYNLVIQRDKKQLIDNPKKIKSIFMDAFRQACGKSSKVSDSTKVITCKVGNIGGYNFSFDVAIFIECNDGFVYKLINDKNAVPSRYIWNKIPKSQDYEYKFLLLKRDGYWDEIKTLYRNKKNKFLKSGEDISSFEILLSVINELTQKHRINL